MNKQYLLFLAGFFFYLNLSHAKVSIAQRQQQLKHFPCMKCHINIKNDAAQFPLKTPHNNMTFKHNGENIKSCFLCHDKLDRNKLILISGEKISFNQSFKQCAQCHGEKKRDWDKGIHGKQVGSWNGDKYKESCTNCHNPHAPKFKKMMADPGPKHPRNQPKHNKKGH